MTTPPLDLARLAASVRAGLPDNWGLSVRARLEGAEPPWQVTVFRLDRSRLHCFSVDLADLAETVGAVVDHARRVEGLAPVDDPGEVEP